MPSLNTKAVLFLVCVAFAFVLGQRDFTYHDLEAMDAACPPKDRCSDYRNNLTYMERSCECDSQCAAYRDCCIDAFARRSGARTVYRHEKCIPYGSYAQAGVYAISRCSSNWTGPREVRERCVGALNFTDPLSAAPLTDTSRSLTYRNLFCAECNNANMSALQTFHIRMSCETLQQEISESQIWSDLTYNEELGSWGVNRLNSHGNATRFVGCSIIFDVPGYLNSSVRFCRSNIISTCASNWTRRRIKEGCSAYMAVVYDSNAAYRNPHCAICNHRSVGQIFCTASLLSRKRPMSFALLLDVNQSDGDQVGMRRVATPSCPSNHKYDPFFKKCRQLVCALPGHEVVNGKCVSGTG